MSIREIRTEVISGAVKELCERANLVLRPDVLRALEEARDAETASSSVKMLDVLVENAKAARKNSIPICQDTGMAVVFVEMGADIHIEGGTIPEAVNKGVAEAYEAADLRKSVVTDPLKRDNSGNNTPAVIHLEQVPGSSLKISVLPKGFGSENKSAIRMMNPTSSERDIIDFCVDTVKKAGPDACPPFVLGVGIGGTMDSCAMMAKKALLRPLQEKGPDRAMEEKIKQAANALGIGVMGLGGKCTVIGVKVMKGPTHIAGLPVAVNICCHALRSASTEL